MPVRTAIILSKSSDSKESLALFDIANKLDNSSKLTRLDASGGNIGRAPKMTNVFSNQALNTLVSWAERSIGNLPSYRKLLTNCHPIRSEVNIFPNPSSGTRQTCDLFVTDPPYADAVNYEEITEYFIAWLRKNPPAPFDQWIWDSRRALAIKGDGEDFRRGMVDAYTAMANHMPDNGLQCVMFTHQDTGVWADMVSIFWAAGCVSG